MNKAKKTATNDTEKGEFNPLDSITAVDLARHPSLDKKDENKNYKVTTADDLTDDAKKALWCTTGRIIYQDTVTTTFW